MRKTLLTLGVLIAAQVFSIPVATAAISVDGDYTEILRIGKTYYDYCQIGNGCRMFCFYDDFSDFVHSLIHWFRCFHDCAVHSFDRMVKQHSFFDEISILCQVMQQSLLSNTWATTLRNFQTGNRAEIFLTFFPSLFIETLIAGKQLFCHKRNQLPSDYITSG